MKKLRISKEGARRPIACVAALSLAALSCGALTACGADEAGTEEPAQEAEAELPGFTAHGLTYSKAETVAATSTLDGEVTAIAVDEWIKNPDGLEEVHDRSNLQQIATDSDEVSFAQDGDEVTWNTGGMDVRYTGVTSQELPFRVEYSYKLDGKKVDPAELQGTTGKLKVTISYTDIATMSVDVDGEEREVAQPFAMAAIVAFDAEHARNVSVTTGTVVDQDGSYMAVGIALPGLADTLELGSEVSLPEKVTITADVKGFDMPSITTMATNQLFAGFSGDASENVSEGLDSAFSQVSGATEALGKLVQGAEGVSQALNTIKGGQDKLDAALSNASGGFAQLGSASEGLVQGVAGAQGSVGGVQKALDGAEQALEALRAVDMTGMEAGQRAALNAALEQLEGEVAAAQQGSADGASALEGASALAGQLSAGLSSASEGLAQLQQGYAQLTAATGSVSEASAQLAQGVGTMSGGLSSTIAELRSLLEGKLDIVETLGSSLKEAGAFCGSAPDMDASTTFIVTASPDA